MYLHPDFEHLIDNALWLVMDPWTYQPKVETNHRINYINNYFCAFISYSLQKYKIRHKCISLDETKFVRSEYFSAYNNINDVQRMKDYLSRNSLNKVVYTGFHNGLCIIDKNTGSKNIRKFATTYAKKDCICTLGFTQDHQYPFADRDEYTKQNVDYVI